MSDQPASGSVSGSVTALQSQSQSDSPPQGPSTSNASSAPPSTKTAPSYSNPSGQTPEHTPNEPRGPRSAPNAGAHKPAKSTRAQRIPIDQITVQDPANERAELDHDKIDELARSISSTGLINPITVRPIPGGYELIAGMNRLQAMRHHNQKYIEATVLHVDDLTAQTIRLTENVARSNLSAFEEATQLQNLVEKHPNGVDGVATMVGRSPNWILDRLDIIAYPASLQQHIHLKNISLAAAKHLAQITPSELQELRIHQAAHHGITAATASLWLQDARAEQAPPPAEAPPDQPLPLQEYVTETKVLCLICSGHIKLEDTQLVRACGPCIADIQRAKFAVDTQHAATPTG